MPQEKKKTAVRRKVLLVDTSKCIGCRACQMACKEWHETDSENMIETETALVDGYEDPKDLSYKTWIRVQSIETVKDGRPGWLFKPALCLHCTNAACLNVCPQTRCIYKDPKSGNSVVLNDARCIGCLYCVYACPFSIPRYNRKTKTVFKCTRCYDKVGAGEEWLPACVQACPSGALMFGDAEEVSAIANRRVESLKTSGKSEVCTYGERATYLGGLGVVYILESTDAALYDLPPSPYIPASISMWQGFWKPLTYIVPAAILLLWVLHYTVIGPLGVKVVEEPEEEEEIEMTPEEYERMILAKRRAGKAMQAVDKRFIRHRHKLPRKGFPPGKRPVS